MNVKKLVIAVLVFLASIAVAHGQTPQCYYWDPVTSTWKYNTACSQSPIAPWQIFPGKVFTVKNTLSFLGQDNASLDIGAGGVLGTAAYASAGSFMTVGGALTGLATTSITSLTVGTGTRTLAISAGLSFAQNMPVTITYNSNGAIWMYGTVTSYTGTSLVVNVLSSNGSGTYAYWTVAASGPPGASGATGSSTAWGTVFTKTTSYNLLAADTGYTFNMNCATACSAVLPSAASYPATYRINSIGAGALTVVGTVNGAVNPVLNRYDEILIYSDGYAWWGNTSVGLPIGSGAIWFTTTAPAGYIFAQGQCLAQAGTYADLYAVIGSTYSATDGCTTGNFGIPDLRGRIPLGAGQGNTAEGGGTGTNRVLATESGAETHTQTVAEIATHDHGGVTGEESVTHTHPITGGAAVTTVAGNGNLTTDPAWTELVDNSGPSTGTESVTHTHTIPFAGGSSPMAIMNPFIVVNYIVKYK